MQRLSVKSLSVSLTVTAALLLGACDSQEDTTSLVTPIPVIRPVKLFTIEAQNAVDIRRFPAELAASKTADLAFRVGGQLQRLSVSAGQAVKKGDLLAQLDPKDFQLQVDLAEANYRLATAQFSRVSSLSRQNAASQSQLDEAKAALDQATNALETAKNRLSYTQLSAPFDGVIAQVDTENHQYVNATQALLKIVDINQMDVQFQVPERLIANIQRSDVSYRPNITVDVAPDLIFQGQYKKHNTTPDATTKAYDVTLSLLNRSATDITLLPGMTANIDIDISQLLGVRKHIMVPVEAVIESHGTGENSERKVWIFNPESQQVIERTVTVGELQGNHIEVLSGISAGEQIVAAGVHSLHGDMKVRPWTRERGL